MDLYVDAITEIGPEQKYIDFSQVIFQIAGNYAFFNELKLAEVEYLNAAELVQDKRSADAPKFSIFCKINFMLAQLYLKMNELDKAFEHSEQALLAVDEALDFDGGEEEKAEWKQKIEKVHQESIAKMWEIVAANDSSEPPSAQATEASPEDHHENAEVNHETIEAQNEQSSEPKDHPASELL